MASIHIDYYSEILRKQTSMAVIFPEEKSFSYKDDHSVLYLLHGREGNHTSFYRFSSIEQYVKYKNVVVVMPDAYNSYYIDMKHGYDYFKLITEELPMKINSFLKVSFDRTKNFICGISMGGYGAFKAALTYPHRFARAGSLSGALDLNNRINSGSEDPFIYKLFQNCLGTEFDIKNSEDDLFFLIEKALTKKKDFPMMYQRCGSEDFLYKDNRTFYDFCTKRNIQLNYNESSGGHDWDYWDDELKKFIDWLPLENIAEE